MSNLLPPHVPQDVQETPYQYPVDASGMPLQQNQFQPGAAHAHYPQQQEIIYADAQQDSAYNHYSQPNAPSLSYHPQPESKTYSDEEWSSPPVPHPHSNAPSNSYQQFPQNTTTPVDPPSERSVRGTRQYIPRQQQPIERYTSYGYHDQLLKSYWPRQLYPEQPTYSGEFHRIANTPQGFRHAAPQQFRGAPGHTVSPGGNALAGLRIEEQNQYGGLSAKAAGKRKAVDSDDDDDDSRFGASSSGAMKRLRSNTNTQQMALAPSRVPHPNFNVTGGVPAPSTSAGPSNDHYFAMAGMDFNLDDQFEASRTQSHQHMPSTQNGSSASRSQVPRDNYSQNARHQGWQAQNANYRSGVASQSVHQSSQLSPVVDRYKGQNQRSRSRAVVFQSVSLLRELYRTHCKGQPGDRWGVVNGKDIVLVRVLHQGRPGTLQGTGIASISPPTSMLRIICDPRERDHVHRIAVNALSTMLKNSRAKRSHTQNGPPYFRQSADHFSGPSGHSLPTPARTPTQPDAVMRLNKGFNGPAPSSDYFSHSSGHTLPTPGLTPVHPDAAVQTQNGFQPSAGYFAGPSGHSLPASARSLVQPIPIQAPPSIPLITVEDTDTTGPGNDFSSTAPVRSESPRVRIDDPGEDESRLPIRLPIPTTLLPDERQAESVGEQAKMEEEASGGTLEGPRHTDITDTPWYRKYILSGYGEQLVASSPTTLSDFQPPTDYFSRPPGQTLPTPARTPAQPDAGFQTQNDFQQSSDYLANPSVYSLPASAHPSVQSTATQTPPPVPVVTVEDTDTTDALSVDDARLPAPTPAESPEVQNEDSGEDELDLSPAPVPSPTTPLAEEKQAHTAGRRVKTEDDNKDDTLQRMLSVVITDMPWYQEYAASAHEEQPVESTLTNSVEDHSATDEDGVIDDKEYHHVYTEFMVNDEEGDDDDDNGYSLFGSPLRRKT